ncbi:snaclec subunit A-like [Asterias amurensis]|uniref:snaclec subunit A-like n=1 Tax=Asterias amurensis TaxID=7602 RepID=UPI003AB15953
MKLTICLAALVTVIALSQWCPMVWGDCPAMVIGSCSSGWKQWERACYMVNTGKANFEDAHKVCAKKGAVMAAPRSHAENEFLADLLKTGTETTITASWVNCVTSSNATTSCKCYGDDQKAYYFTPTWKTDDPTGTEGENCVILHVRQDSTYGKWSDTACDGSRVFACKRPAGQLHF